VLAAALLGFGCSGTAAAPSSGAAPHGAGGLERGRLIFELRKPLGIPGNPIASHNFVCGACPNELSDEFEEASLPEGFERTEWRELVARRSNARAVPGLGDVAPLDVLASVEGAEFVLAAAPREGQLVDGWAFVTMSSDRDFEWDAGDVVHEISDGQTVYIAFAVQRGTVLDSLATLVLPSGWSYRSRMLDAPLKLDAGGEPRVALSLTAAHLWQRRE
jgi:hypothetical protein